MFKMMCLTIFINGLYNLDTHNIPGFRNAQDIIIKKRNGVALTIKINYKFAKKRKYKVPKSFIMKQFSIV